MKNQLSLLFTMFFCSILICCSTSNNSEKEDQSKESEDDKIEKVSKKDVSELTYRDVVELVFNDEGEGIEWHGEEMSNDLVESVVFSSEEACGEEDCGKAMYITSTEDAKTIEIIMKGAYDIDGDIGYIARKYTLAPGGKLSIGCSHLCYDGKGYVFDRQIVGSVYSEE